MGEQDSVWFYGKGTSAADVLAEATPLFKLFNVTIKYDLTRSVSANQRLPGAEYSKGYDAQSMAGGITIEGEFVPVDATWNGTTFIGRPFDFIHYLKCFANGIDPTTGVRLTSSTYNCFSILIRQTYEGTPRAYAPGIFGTTIKNYYAIGKTSFILDGGMNRTVKFSIPLTEVSDMVNLGRM
jgi:hypothetical protein